MKQTEAVKLQTYIHNWRAINPQRWRQGAQIVANDLTQDAAFTDIKIAGFLESPAGVTVAQVVEGVLPFPNNAEAAVMVDAIEIAAKKKSGDQVVVTLAIGFLAVIILWGLFGESQLSSRRH